MAHRTGGDELQLRSQMSESQPPLSQNRNRMYAENQNEMSVDMSADNLTSLKRLKQRIQAAQQRVMPTVGPNGDILAGLIGNASDIDMDV